MSPPSSSTEATANPIRWRRVVVASGIALAAGYLAVVAIIAGYALGLGFAAQGAPDEARIEAFADRVAPVWGPILGALATLVAALGAARGAPGRPATHGLLVGTSVALVALALDRSLAAGPLLSFVGTVAAGALGGVAGGWLRARGASGGGVTRSSESPR